MQITSPKGYGRQTFPNDKAPGCRRRARRTRQLLRPRLHRLGGMTRAVTKSPHIDCNEDARNLLPCCSASFLSDGILAKKGVGLAERRQRLL